MDSSQSPMYVTRDADPEFFAQRHRGGVLLEKYGIDLYPHPYLGFSLAPGHRSRVINTDEEGFRLSASPFGPVGSSDWISAGGGGIILGNSVVVGLAATSDSTTIASHLALLTGTRQLNLGVPAANSLQELVAAVPFLRAAATVIIVGGGPDFGNMLGTRHPWAAFGAISYERTFAKLARVPLFDLADLAAGKTVAASASTRRPPGTDPEPLPRIEAAARIRLRDLAIMSRAVNEGTRILFCLQPMATPRSRALTPEERAVYDFDAPVFGIYQATIEDCWSHYAELLAQGCTELGVSFFNMSADLFTGFAFSDNLHLTDNGNQQAAQMIQRALGKAFATAAGPSGLSPQRPEPVPVEPT